MSPVSVCFQASEAGTTSSSPDDRSGGLGAGVLLYDKVVPYVATTGMHTLTFLSWFFSMLQSSHQRREKTFKSKHDVAGQEPALTLHGLAASRLFCQRRTSSRQLRSQRPNEPADSWVA